LIGEKFEIASKPDRKFVKEGLLIFKKKMRWYFLFSDILVETNKKKDNKYKLKTVMNLKDAVLSAVPNTQSKF